VCEESVSRENTPVVGLKLQGWDLQKSKVLTRQKDMAKVDA